MPTGYTAGVGDGTVTDFREFALRCARNFGALIAMRDEPWDAPIPDEFQPSTYHRDKIAETTAEVERLEAMGDAEKERASQAAYEEQRHRWAEGRAKERQTRQRYETMLDAVYAWEPPSPEHREMREFMADQLNQSIKFDTGIYREAPEPQDPDEWHAEQLSRARRNLAYHVEHWELVVERTRERNKWVRQLRESLPEPHTNTDSAVNEPAPTVKP